jgi:hypothetical protein
MLKQTGELFHRQPGLSNPTFLNALTASLAETIGSFIRPLPQ